MRGRLSMWKWTLFDFRVWTLKKMYSSIMRWWETVLRSFEKLNYLSTWCQKYYVGWDLDIVLMKIYPHLNPKERRIIIFLCFVEDTERQAAKTPDTLDFCLDHSFFRASAPYAWQKHQGPWSGSPVIFPGPDIQWTSRLFLIRREEMQGFFGQKHSVQNRARPDTQGEINIPEGSSRGW